MQPKHDPRIEQITERLDKIELAFGDAGMDAHAASHNRRAKWAALWWKVADKLWEKIISVVAVTLLINFWDAIVSWLKSLLH